jgi:abhydrolase domain-containing protein 12
LDCNVLAIDYRGFGDSTGTPSEEGLIRDAKAVWDYVDMQGGGGGRHGGGEEKGVVLVGQSLGTGVVAGLAGLLADRGTSQYAREGFD